MSTMPDDPASLGAVQYVLFHGDLRADRGAGDARAPVGAASRARRGAALGTDHALGTARHLRHPAGGDRPGASGFRCRPDRVAPPVGVRHLRVADPGATLLLRAETRAAAHSAVRTVDAARRNDRSGPGRRGGSYASPD